MRCLFLFFISLTALGHQPPPPPLPTPTPSAPLPIAPTETPSILQKLRTLGGTPVVDDPAGSQQMEYIVANEEHGALFEACLKQPHGALITVGSFRGLNNASSGKVSQLVQLDYSAGVTQFNLVNAQLIAMAKDRFEYLSMLLVGARQNAYLEKARSGEMSVLNYVEALTAPGREAARKLDRGDLTAIPVRLPDKWKKLGVTLESAEAWKPLYRSSEGEVNNSPIEFLLWNEKKFPRSLQDLEKEGSGLEQSIFGNDGRFGVIKKMVEEGRVTVIQGDLTGAKAMPALAAALREQQIGVSAVDVSNVPGYFLDDKEDGAENWRKMKENLSRMPYTSEGRIFLTEHNNVFYTEGEYQDKFRARFGVKRRPELQKLSHSWYYYAVKATDLSRLDEEFQKAKKDESGIPQHAFGLQLDQWLKPDPSQPQTPPFLFTPPAASCK